MGMIASQITSITIVYSTVYSDADQRKHQSSASLAFVRKMFPFDDVIMSVQFMMSANSQIRFGLQIVFVSLYITPSHSHHCTNLSEDIELIYMPLRYILSIVSVRLSIFSQLSIIQYVELCVFSLLVSSVMIEWIYILCLIIIKSEVWTITHCLGLGHETMVCAVCLSICLRHNFSI